MYSVFFCSARCRELLLLCLCASVLWGCGGKTFSDGDIRATQSVRYGTVLDVTDVMVVEEPSLVGPGIGAAAGGLLGSAFGAGTGRTLFILGGAVLGADIGGGIDYRKRRYKALQITIELDSGNVLVVVQGYNEYFVKGDKVRVLHMGEDRATVQLV